MILQPHHLKYFRNHFHLTMEQCAVLTGVPRKQWWRWEAGYDQPQEYITGKLQFKAAFLIKALKHAEAHCPYCTKQVAGYASRKGHCIHCGRDIRRSKVALVQQVMPEKGKRGAADKQLLKELENGNV